MSSAGVGSKLPFWMIRSNPFCSTTNSRVEVARRADRIVGRGHSGRDRLQANGDVALRNVGQDIL